MTTIAPTLGSWTRGQRLQLSMIVAVIAVLHVLGWSLYLSVTHGSAGAGSGDLKQTGPGRTAP